MIKVLQDWQEVGEVSLSLQKKGLPMHNSVQKNWDHYILDNILESTNRNSTILDLGCGDGYTLKFLQALGFQNLYGIDYLISWKLRLGQLKNLLKFQGRKKTFTLCRGDIHQTPFGNDFFDVVYSISTVEHGVNMQTLLREVHRVLKLNSLFLLTTDYWETKIETDNSIRAYGLPWKIFSKDEMEILISNAKDIGFDLVENTPFPKCSKKTVFWQDQEYTFIALLFRKIR